MTDRINLTDKELLYAATDRCRCGAGMAHPLDHALSMKIRAWVCSAALKGEVDPNQTLDRTLEVMQGKTAAEDTHDLLPWALWKVREETSINNAGAHTTRPPGTVARTVGTAKCPTCSHEWKSEPYVACGLGHHWYSGPCPGCGYAVGGAGTWRSDEGTPIEKRYLDVVLDVATPEPGVEEP